MNIFSGQIIAKKPGVWQVRFYLGKDANGKRITKSYTIHGTIKEAERFKVRFWDAFEAGKYNRKKYLFAELWQEYFAAKELAPKTKKVQINNYRRHIAPFFDKMDVEKITPADVAKWLLFLRRYGLAHSTINTMIGLLKAFFNWACELEVLDKNPAARLKKLPNMRKGNDPLSEQEITSLLDVCKRHEDLLPIAFALVTGMRPEEYCCVRWEDIDFQTGFVTVRRVAYTEAGERKTREGAKNLYSMRSVCISKQILQLLAARRNSQSPFVFVGRKDANYISPATLADRFKKALKLAGITRHLRLYDLRHSCATFLASNGRPIKDVAAFLGHSSPNTTLKFYTHAQRAQAIACAEAFSSLQAAENSVLGHNSPGEILTNRKLKKPEMSRISCAS